MKVHVEVLSNHLRWSTKTHVSGSRQLFSQRADKGLTVHLEEKTIKIVGEKNIGAHSSFSLDEWHQQPRFEIILKIVSA